MKSIKVSSKKESRIIAQSANIQNWKERAEAAYSLQLANKHCGGVVHVTVPSPGKKLDGFDGVNTSVTNNPACIARRAKALEEGDFGCVCLYCYADNMMNVFKGAEMWSLYNQNILTSHILSDEEIARIPLYRQNGRFEMFGDVANLTQAVNYIHIAAAHSTQFYAVWSKNLSIWHVAFEREGKPDNLVFVQSSVHLNKVDTISANMEQYTDYVFTVCDSEETYERMIEGYNGKACAGVSCLGCLHCYRRGNPRYVFELLRK